MVLDDDGSNEVTSFEFKQLLGDIFSSPEPHGIVDQQVNVCNCRLLRACRAYGYRGPAKLAFKAPYLFCTCCDFC